MRTDVEDALNAIAHSESPRPTFASVVRILARSHGHRPREFLRYFPWVKAAWKKICREADRAERMEQEVKRQIELERKLKRG